MTPAQLLDEAVTRIREWQLRPLVGSPTLQLTMMREKAPLGRTVRMFGDRGPKGDVCLVRPRGDAWMVVASFSAVAVANFLSEAAGRPLRLKEMHAPARDLPEPTDDP